MQLFTSGFYIPQPQAHVRDRIHILLKKSTESIAFGGSNFPGDGEPPR